MVEHRIPRRHQGELRFGHSDQSKGHGKMISRQMTDEEYQKYFGGDRKVHSKEDYLRLKEEKKTDVQIQKAWGINNATLHGMKKRWGVIGVRVDKKMDNQSTADSVGVANATENKAAEDNSSLRTRVAWLESKVNEERQNNETMAATIDQLMTEKQNWENELDSVSQVASKWKDHAEEVEKQNIQLKRSLRFTENELAETRNKLRSYESISEFTDVKNGNLQEKLTNVERTLSIYLKG